MIKLFVGFMGQTKSAMDAQKELKTNKGVRKMKKVLLFSACLLFLSGCSRMGVDETKSVATKEFEKNGFEIVAYEGYNYNILPFPASVWYVVKRKDDPTTLYNCYLQKTLLDNEYHIYNLKALNAIKGN